MRTRYEFNPLTGELDRVADIVAYDDVQVQISGARIPSSNYPSWAAYKGSEVLAFSKSATNSISFSCQLPHAYKEGSNLEFHIHLAYPDATAGNSVWQFSYSWANRGVAFPAQSTTDPIVVPAPGVADQHALAELVPSIAGTGKTISSILLCNLSRLGGDGSDTYDNVIYLVGADFHYLRDSNGSRQETVK